MFDLLIVFIIGYFIGNIQFSYIIAKLWKKKDIRNFGTGNAGATNFIFTIGPKMGVLVAILDILKAVFSLYLIRWIFPSLLSDNSIFPLYLNGFGVILGHNFPLFLGFKGGKGTASSLGFLFGLNVKFGIIGFLLIFFITIASGYIAYGALSLSIFILFLAVYYNYGLASITVSLLLIIMVYLLHRNNFKRIKNKEEKSVKDLLQLRKENLK